MTAEDLERADLIVENAELKGRVAAALHLHRRRTQHSLIRGEPDPVYCGTCGRWATEGWPCPTTKALTGEG